MNKTLLLEETKELVKLKAKQYYIENKEHILAKRKEYRENNSDKIKEYNDSKKLEIKERNKQWYKDNSNHVKEYGKEYRLENSEKRKKYTKLYREKNKFKINQDKNEVRNNNGIVRLIDNIRRNIRHSFTSKGLKKNTKTEKILGCTFEEFKLHLEKHFTDWMTWENHGNPKDGVFELNKSWDIDHVIPLSSAKTEEEIIILNHYTNLQPLCSYNNRYIKRNLLD